MKKYIPIILVLLLLLTACGKEEAEQTTIPTTAAPTIQTEPPATEDPEGILEEKDTETVYLLARMSVLDENGQEIRYREYEYNEKGQLAEEFEYSENTLSYRTVYTYDESGRCTTMQTHHMDYFEPEKVASRITITYTYDEKGNILLQQTYEDDTLVSYDEFTYDNHGNHLTYKMYFGGELAYDWAYRCIYDKNGNLLSREEFLDGQLAYRVEFTYDEQNRCTGNTTYTFDGSVESQSVITWEGTTETRTYYDMEGCVSLTTVTTCDEQGNIAFQENQYSDGTVTMTEYFYEPFEIVK